MDAPAASELVRLRAELRVAGVLLAVAAAVLVAFAAALGHLDAAWPAWAAGAYVSWAVAFTVLVRRRLARAARTARPLPSGVREEERPAPPRGGAPWAFAVALAAFLAVATLAGATDLAGGIVAAAASASLAAARWVGRLEELLGGTLYVDRSARPRGAGPFDPRRLWVDAASPPSA